MGSTFMTNCSTKYFVMNYFASDIFVVECMANKRRNKLGSKWVKLSAENRMKPWSVMQNQAKRINEIALPLFHHKQVCTAITDTHPAMRDNGDGLSAGARQANPGSKGLSP
jgi:hypothetical protein